MQATRLTNYIAFVGVLAANLASGLFVSALCRVYGDAYPDVLEGVALPRMTEVVLHYDSVASPILVGAIVGLLCFALLATAERSESLRPHLALLTSLGWMLALLHCVTAATALALPFVPTLHLHNLS